MNPLALLRAFDDAVMPVRCVFCGTRVRAGEGFVCSDCFEDLPWRYSAPALAQHACAALDNLPAGIDAVLPVPLHWRRQWLRGFNQAHEIAKPVAKWLGVPLIRDVRRRRATAPQSGLSARGRTDNLRNAFDARRGIARRHVLIIDDVMTTGTTVRQLGRAVLAAGAASVSALAVARAGP
ncbi:MAG: phosphoribosyltransferase family protein [Woeseiaceae bacterium]|jgi:ComF family protein